MPGRWLIALQSKEESPGSTKIRCQLTAGGGNPRDSATENKPPYQGKGEKVWYEHTGRLVTIGAWKTPPRARLNRDGNVRNN